MLIEAKNPRFVRYDILTPKDNPELFREFMNKNKDVIKRVFDEGLSIMKYELSCNQMEAACLVFLQSKYFPSSVNEVDVYQI